MNTFLNVPTENIIEKYNFHHKQNESIKSKPVERLKENLLTTRNKKDNSSIKKSHTCSRYFPPIERVDPINRKYISICGK